jgi:creatinine amidohydrolase
MANANEEHPDFRTLYRVPGPKTLLEMTWREVESERNSGTDIALITVGSVEPHGLHAPLGNDALLAREYARHTLLHLNRMGVRAVIAPPVHFGLNPQMMNFPGAIDLRPETLMALLTDICRSLYRHGFVKQALMTAHAENWPLLIMLAQQLTHDPGIKVVALNWARALYARHGELLDSKKFEGHGGEGETSRLMAVHPELVDLTQAVPFYVEEHGTPEQRAIVDRRARDQIPFDSFFDGGGLFRPPRDFGRDQTTVGHFGDPGLATVEKGRRALDIVGEWQARLIRRELAGDTTQE